jgi:hypothetical protein
MSYDDTNNTVSNPMLAQAVTETAAVANICLQWMDANGFHRNAEMTLKMTELVLRLYGQTYR